MRNLKRNIILILIIALFCILLTNCKKESKSTEEAIKTYNPINSIAFDDKGNTWFGKSDGLYYTDGNKIIKLKTEPSSLSINALTFHEGNLWAATNNGILKFSISTDNQISITTNYNQNNSNINSDKVYTLAFDASNRLWCGTSNGLAIYDGSSWKKNKEIQNNLIILSGIDVTSIAFRDNDCHVATNGKNLIHVRLNTLTDAITGASQMLGGENASQNYNGDLTTDTVYCAYTTRDSSLWFGSKKGLTRNKGSNHQGSPGAIFEYALVGQHVHAIVETTDGKIWAGTENGLFVKENNNWKNYTQNLPDNYIVALSVLHNVVWIQTKTGIAYFNNESITNIK